MRRTLVLLLMLSTALGLFTSVPVAQAADQVVTNCSSDTQLRNKLSALQSTGGGTLTFNCGKATILLDGGVLTVTGNITIDGGKNITLSGANTTRLFYIAGGATLTLQNIVLTNGLVNNDDGGAIYNDGTLILAYATVQNSQTDAA